jgi:uncharacterized protein (DUF1778 family)
VASRTDKVRTSSEASGTCHVSEPCRLQGSDRVAGDQEEKWLLATAAAYKGLEMTSFIMPNVLPAAREVIDCAERITLSERDTRRVLDLLENRPSRPRRCSPPHAAVSPAADRPNQPAALVRENLTPGTCFLGETAGGKRKFCAKASIEYEPALEADPTTARAPPLKPPPRAM